MYTAGVLELEKEIVRLFDRIQVRLGREIRRIEPRGVEYTKVGPITGKRDVVWYRRHRTRVDVRGDTRDNLLGDEVDDRAFPDARFTEDDDVDRLRSSALISRWWLCCESLVSFIRQSQSFIGALPFTRGGVGNGWGTRGGVGGGWATRGEARDGGGWGARC